MTLFQDFVEPFDDLSQWSFLGSTGSDPTVADGAVVFPIGTGQSVDRRIIVNDYYDLEDSYVSFRLKTVGSYPEVVGSTGVGGSLTLASLHDYPGFPGLTLVVGATVVTLDDEAQPIIAIYSEGEDVHLAYSLDGSAPWTILGSSTLTVLDPTDLGIKLILGCQAFGAASSDYVQEFDQINMFSPFGPSLTEVDKTVSTSWNVQPYYLRHYSWHVHHSVFKYLEAQLDTMGWTSATASERPFGAAQVRLQETLPPEFDMTRTLSPGTVAVTLGSEPDTKEEELGGVLNSHDLPLFIDIFMEDEALALALANDIRDIFKGRVPGSSRLMQVIDWASPGTTPATGYTVEFEDVVRERPETKLNWQIVKVSAVLFFNDVIYM